LIDVDLEAACAECGQAAVARFDIQSFVLQRTLYQREGVLSEVHALAGAYGWSLNEILGLPRSLRRSLAERLAAARGTGLRRAIGELLICPYCVGMWIAAAFTAGLIVAPRATRWTAAALSTLFGSDILQIAYKKAEAAR
jgi:hypothetical protein